MVMLSIVEIPSVIFSPGEQKSNRWSYMMGQWSNHCHCWRQQWSCSWHWMRAEIQQDNENDDYLTWLSRNEKHKESEKVDQYWWLDVVEEEEFWLPEILYNYTKGYSLYDKRCWDVWGSLYFVSWLAMTLKWTISSLIHLMSNEASIHL